MNRRLPTIFGTLFGLVLLQVTLATTLAVAQTEIDYLLGYIGVSGCEFYRNGTWHDANTAQAHLRRKYAWLAAGNRINTAEEFIDKAAARSGISDRAYEVRCGGETLTSQQWLRHALARHRETGR